MELQDRAHPPTTEAIYLALRGVIHALDRNTAELQRNTHKQGELMSSFADATAAVEGLKTNVGTLVTATDALIAAAQAAGGLSAADQAKLDQAIVDVQSARDTVAGEVSAEQGATPAPPPAP